MSESHTEYDRKQIFAVATGDVYCCGEYATCEYLIDAVSIYALELGLRWLHDRAYSTPFESGLPLAVELRLQFLERRIERLLGEESIQALELGLRWLHDRSAQCKCIRCIWMHGPTFDTFLQQLWRDANSGVIASLELGLRWLHDRANDDWISPNFPIVAVPLIEQVVGCWGIELGLRWLHDRGSRCDRCGAVEVSDYSLPYCGSNCSTGIVYRG